MASDPNFPAYRQYQYLRRRCLLNMQAQIAALEKRLEEFDSEDAKTDYKKLMSLKLDEYQASPFRQELLAEIQGKLKEYGLHFAVLV